MKPPGHLYIVATPIGNLADISARVLEVLKKVDVIAAEDTRQSRKLLGHFGIKTPVIAHHQHNEVKSALKLNQRLLDGESIALVSDAGTPLVSDPGATLVKTAHENGIRVIPIPGASAVSSALSVCGLKFRQFHFEGFLPSSSGDRKRRIRQLSELDSALVFFEAPHRIVASLEDLTDALGSAREVCIAREMTKVYESIRVGKLEDITEQVRENVDEIKGEFVVIVGPASRSKRGIDLQIDQTLNILMQELTPRKAAEITARIFGVRRNLLYQRTLELQSETEEIQSKPD